ncbi:hypothetical protein D9M69_553990 [compost metagenome]
MAHDFCNNTSIAFEWATRKAARFGTHQRQSQLTSQKLVISKPAARDAFKGYITRVFREMHCVECIFESMKTLACDQRPVDPLGQNRHAGQCFFHCAAKGLG